jgi:hypothetical protein
MAIFHGYVKLPEGKSRPSPPCDGNQKEHGHMKAVES